MSRVYLIYWLQSLFWRVQMCAWPTGITEEKE